MQNQFGALDCIKLTWLLEETNRKLNFLSTINKEDDASSELAGYEINKLLTKQADLESTYAHKLQVRASLKGISNKRKLDECQKEIQEVAHQLKESTKKLGRLFRENPDLASDAREIAEEREALLSRLEGVIGLLMGGSFTGFQVELINDLEDQDSLRKLIIQEKTLINEIKQLHLQWKNENAEYQNEINEKQANIQKHKEKLVKAKTKADIATRYLDKEIKALEGTQNRIHKQNLDKIQNEIDMYEKKRKTEVAVFEKVEGFLRQQESEIKHEVDVWNQKFEKTREEKEQQIEKLTMKRDKLDEDIRELKEKIEMENAIRKEKERREIEADEDKRRKREEDEALDDAVKKIQDFYKAWKDAGGTVKKKKKKKKKKA